ncbi:MAG: hypothetical protein C7B47_10955 [Sulfobacillus thermosulfidooxidans]|uniref:Uncharacterized protein n=1 Tax=Sulfobacillus thermosulfidooxidans TaxID=28034 RepID=A0A2T2WVN0_SULTH|nr:MAG: hypothetical protein C7B47_10955 [Sulfobacillus thermosulfidooxidans]
MHLRVLGPFGRQSKVDFQPKTRNRFRDKGLVFVVCPEGLEPLLLKGPISPASCRFSGLKNRVVGGFLGVHPFQGFGRLNT